MILRSRHVSQGELPSARGTWPKTGSGRWEASSAARDARRARLRSSLALMRFLRSREACAGEVVEKHATAAMPEEDEPEEANEEGRGGRVCREDEAMDVRKPDMKDIVERWGVWRLI